MVTKMRTSGDAKSLAGFKLRSVHVLLAAGLCLGAVIGQPSAASDFKINPSPRRLEGGEVAGPLVLRGFQATHHWMRVDWDPKSPLAWRSVGGRDPAEYSPVAYWQIQLSHIEPRFVDDAAERERLRQIYVKGLEKILANQRRFWFQVTNTSYAGPGQIGGVLILDKWPGGSLIHEEMVRSGYAQVSSHNPSEVNGNYGIRFRDELLRLEGAARAQKLGIWAKD